MQRTLQSCFLSTLSALVGLVSVLVTGWIAWNIGSGISGIMLGACVAGAVAMLLKRCGMVVSIFAGCFGAAVASYLAVATAEQLPPGSIEWVLKGGLYGAAVGLPLAFLLGTLGLIESNAVQMASPGRKEKNEP